MRVMTKQEVDVVADVRCDICDESTSGHGRHSPQFGTLQAQWGYGASMMARLMKCTFVSPVFSVLWLRFRTCVEVN